MKTPAQPTRTPAPDPKVRAAVEALARLMARRQLARETASQGGQTA